MAIAAGGKDVKPYKLGKDLPRFDARTLQFANYITPGLPPPPDSVNYAQTITSWPMMGNDKYGDCTCAAAGHLIEEWTGNNGTPKILPDSQILAAYKHFAGNDPDAGANMLDVLKYWRKTGIGGDKLLAFAQLEPGNTTQVQDSVYLFGGCYIGVALPNFAVPPGVDYLSIPWVVPPQGPVGDAAPNPNNGHCIPAVAYDQRNVYVVTWGALKAMSWQFYTTYMDEAYAPLSHDWINSKTGTAPSGFNLAQLLEDLKNIK